MEVIFPVFEKCKKYSQDPFWQELFDRLSKGKFSGEVIGFNPKDYEVTFCYLYDKKKEICKRLPQKKNSLSLFELVKNQLHRLGVYSKGELPQCFAPLFVFTKWSQIKSKTTKEELISEYVDRKYGKNPNKFFEILSLLQVKHITPSDIEMADDGKIKNINIKPLPTAGNPNFPKYEYPKKTNPLSSNITRFSKERFSRGA